MGSWAAAAKLKISSPDPSGAVHAGAACPHGWESLWKALRVACGTAFQPTTGSRRILLASWSLVSPAALIPPWGRTKTAVRPGLGCTVPGMRGHSGSASTRRAQTPKGPAPSGAPGTQ